MAGRYVVIAEAQMRSFLEAQGFTEVKLEGTTEIVYGKRVLKDTTLRIYTSIAHGESRDVGQDAIRVCLVHRLPDGNIRGIGSDSRVYRLATWQENLQKRINKWESLLGPDCPHCAAPTQLRTGKYGEFYGCVRYPECRGIVKIQA